MLEKDIEAKLRKRVKELGGRAYKFVSPGNSGVPDRIIVLPGRKIGFAETKKLGETARKQQERQIKFLQNLGFIAEVIDKAEDIEPFLQRILNQ